MSKFSKQSIGIALLFILLWEVAVRFGVYSELILPSPIDVFQKIVSAFLEDGLTGQIARSLIVVIKGLGIATILTCLVLALSELSRSSKRIFETLCTLFHPLPGVAILPVFMLWFGVGESAIVAVIVHSVIWPLFINLSAGRASVPDIYIQISYGFSITGINKWIHILLPAVLPYLLSGLRTGWARAWRALISAEMIFGAIGDGGGLGWFIFKSRVFMDTAGMFAGLVIVIIVGLIVEKFVFDMIENNTLRKWGIME